MDFRRIQACRGWRLTRLDWLQHCNPDWHCVCVDGDQNPNHIWSGFMKKLGELTVGDYMTVQAIIVDDSKKLTHAIRLMDTESLLALPVIDNQGEVVGILSTRDLIEITHEIQSDLGALSYVTEKTQDFLIKMLIEQGDNTLVRDVMTAPVDTISPDANLIVAARKLMDREYHHLPVVDATGKPVGIISTTDFVRAVADYGATLAG
jgi:CBS domain-containing membrane protein